ncbi:hypothetical protein BH09BAC1_BH09BAC1_16680 [soil metagenome]
MIAFIETVISRFGGRLAGSQEEAAAQQFVKEHLDSLGAPAELQPFRAALRAKFIALKLFTALFFISMALYWYSIPAATILALINGLLFFGHFVTYRNWLDFLFPQMESSNVHATLEPQGPVTQTIVVAGHIDSVREFQWWYHLKNIGGYLTILGGALYVLQGIIFLAIWLIGGTWGDVAWIILAVLSPATFSMAAMHGKRVVDGAIDNLTGVAMAVEMAKVFGSVERGKSRLQNTRLRLVSFGSEECGLRGSTAYVKQNKTQLIKENALLINIDTIKEKHHLSIINGEINTRVRYNKGIVSALNQAFADSGIPVKNITLSVGATDASSFGMQNLPAVSIIGMSSTEFDPCYHTRLDKLENLNPDGIESLKSVLVNFIEGWDTGKYKA